jgi:hypothetical protein
MAVQRVGGLAIESSRCVPGKPPYIGQSVRVYRPPSPFAALWRCGQGWLSSDVGWLAPALAGGCAVVLRWVVAKAVIMGRLAKVVRRSSMWELPESNQRGWSMQTGQTAPCRTVRAGVSTTVSVCGPWRCDQGWLSSEGGAAGARTRWRLRGGAPLIAAKVVIMRGRPEGCSGPACGTNWSLAGEGGRCTPGKSPYIGQAVRVYRPASPSGYPGRCDQRRPVIRSLDCGRGGDHAGIDQGDTAVQHVGRFGGWLQRAVDALRANRPISDRPRRRIDHRLRRALQGAPVTRK